MADRILTPPTVEAPLLAWLRDVLQPTSRTRVKELLTRGLVHVNGAPVTRHDHLLRPGDRVTISHSPAKPSLVTILHEDDAILALDKPAGLLSVATDAEKHDTAFVRLAEHLAAHRGGRPYVLHRLDRETSGVLLFARTAEVRDTIQAGWDAVEKQYLAVVEGTPRPAEGTVRNHLREGRDLRVRAVPAGGDAKPASTHYRVLRSGNGMSLVEVTLETGRKHQIRVHLAGLGCPVIGDRAYGSRTDPVRRLGLHAWKVLITHPRSGERITIESRLPRVLASLV